MFDSELSSKCDSHQIWVATKSSFSAALNKFQFEDKDYAEGDLTPSCHVRISTLGDCQASGAQDIDERNTSELWKTDVDYRLNGDVEAMDSKQDLPQQTESSLTDSEKQTTPNGNTGCHPSDTDYRTTPQYTSSCKYSPNNSTEIHCSAECQLEEDCNLVSDIPCDENMRNLNSCNTVRSRSVPCSSGGSLNSDLPNSSDIKSFTKSSSVHNLSQKCLDQLSETKNGEHYVSIDDSFGQIMDSKPPETYDSSTAFDKKSNNDCDREETTLRYSLSFDANTESDHREEGRNKDDTRVIQQYLSSEHVTQNDNEEKQNGKVGLQRYLSSDNHSNCDNLVVHVEDNHILTESDSGQCKSSESLNSSQNPSLHQQSHVPADVCLNVDSKCVNYEFDNAPNKSDYQCDEDRLSYDQIDPDESEYKQNLKECNSSLEGEYKQSLNGQKQSLDEDGESCYAQEDIDQPSVSNFKQSKEDKNQSSYKQPPAGEVEDMDTETLDEDVEHETLSPSIYQSYEEGAMDYHNAAISALGVPVLAEYNTEGIDSHGEGWAPAVNDRVSFSQLANSDSYSSSSTYTLTQNTVTDTATSSSQDHVMTNPSTSSSSYSSLSSQSQSVGPSTEDHEGALCTGDQTFKSAAARQSALGSFTQNIRSVPFVSSINPSVYAGPAVVQGINRPAIMSSSTVHIAQHPGGATIMRHQSMSAGLSGGMAQATLMQRHAMPNGAQSTSLLQQRTLTNGGQTMVMQQRTMTTGLGAMSQQTVVQQRMTAPNNIAQAAMYQASAMRQQAKIIQQRAIRLAQAQVMGSQLLRAQAYGSAALVQRGAANPSASLIRPGLVRAGGQASVMQHLVRQRYLGGPVMPGRGMQMVAGRPVRVKMTYPRESLSNT